VLGVHSVHRTSGRRWRRLHDRPSSRAHCCHMPLLARMPKAANASPPIITTGHAAAGMNGTRWRDEAHIKDQPLTNSASPAMTRPIRPFHATPGDSRVGDAPTLERGWRYALRWRRRGCRLRYRRIGAPQTARHGFRLCPCFHLCGCQARWRLDCAFLLLLQLPFDRLT
jgi:hypothetical protein